LLRLQVGETRLVNVDQYNATTAQRQENVVCVGANKWHPPWATGSAARVPRATREQELRKHIGLHAYEAIMDEDCGGEAMAVGMIEQLLNPVRLPMYASFSLGLHA
jgi:hypothetical protein